MSAESVIAVGIVSACGSAVAGYAIWRADLRAQQYIAGLEARDAMKVPVVPPESAAKLARKDVTVPDDLVAWANQWQDQWARDDALNDLRQKFLETHTGNTDDTWQAIRRGVGIGELP